MLRLLFYPTLDVEADASIDEKYCDDVFEDNHENVIDDQTNTPGDKFNVVQNTKADTSNETEENRHLLKDFLEEESSTFKEHMTEEVSVLKKISERKADISKEDLVKKISIVNPEDKSQILNKKSEHEICKFTVESSQFRRLSGTEKPQFFDLQLDDQSKEKMGSKLSMTDVNEQFDLTVPEIRISLEIFDPISMTYDDQSNVETGNKLETKEDREHVLTSVDAINMNEEVSESIDTAAIIIGTDHNRPRTFSNASPTDYRPRSQTTDSRKSSDSFVITRTGQKLSSNVEVWQPDFDGISTKQKQSLRDIQSVLRAKLPRTFRSVVHMGLSLDPVTSIQWKKWKKERAAFLSLIQRAKYRQSNKSKTQKGKENVSFQKSEIKGHIPFRPLSNSFPSPAKKVAVVPPSQRNGHISAAKRTDDDNSLSFSPAAITKITLEGISEEVSQIVEPEIIKFKKEPEATTYCENNFMNSRDKSSNSEPSSGTNHQTQSAMRVSSDVELKKPETAINSISTMEHCNNNVINETSEATPDELSTVMTTATNEFDGLYQSSKSLEFQTNDCDKNSLHILSFNEANHRNFTHLSDGDDCESPYSSCTFSSSDEEEVSDEFESYCTHRYSLNTLTVSSMKLPMYTGTANRISRFHGPNLPLIIEEDEDDKMSNSPAVSEVSSEQVISSIDDNEDTLESLNSPNNIRLKAYTHLARLYSSSRGNAEKIYTDSGRRRLSENISDAEKRIPVSIGKKTLLKRSFSDSHISSFSPRRLSNSPPQRFESGDNIRSKQAEETASPNVIHRSSTSFQKRINSGINKNPTDPDQHQSFPEANSTKKRSESDHERDNIEKDIPPRPDQNRDNSHFGEDWNIGFVACVTTGGPKKKPAIMFSRINCDANGNFDDYHIANKPMKLSTHMSNLKDPQFSVDSSCSDYYQVKNQEQDNNRRPKNNVTSNSTSGTNTKTKTLELKIAKTNDYRLSTLNYLKKLNRMKFAV